MRISRYLAPATTVLLLGACLAACGDDETGGAGGSGGAASTAASTTVTSVTVTSSSVGGATATSTTASTGGMGAGGMATGGMGGNGGAGGMAAGGAGGMVNSAFAYIWGDYTANNTYEIGRVDAAGVVSSVMPAGLTTKSSSDVAISPDGTMIAVSGTIGGNTGIYLYAADGSGAATTVVTTTNDANPTAAITSLVFSPGGDYIAYLSDQASAGAMSAYVIPTAGGTARALGAVSMDNQVDAGSVAWANATHAIFGGELTASVFGLWSVDVADANSTPVALVPEGMLAIGQGVDSRITPQVDSIGRIYFRSNHATAVTKLYRVLVNGSALEIVPGTNLPNNGASAFATVTTFGLSPDGLNLAFTADAPLADLGQVYVLNLLAATAVVQSNVNPTLAVIGETRSGTIAYPIRWTSDQSTLIVQGDWPVMAGDPDNEFGLYAVPALGAPSITRLTGVQVGRDVRNFNFLDGLLLSIGDHLISNQDELFGTTDLSTADQAFAGNLVQGVLQANGDVFDIVTYNP